MTKDNHAEKFSKEQKNSSKDVKRYNLAVAKGVNGQVYSLKNERYNVLIEKLQRFHFRKIAVRTKRNILELLPDFEQFEIDLQRFAEIFSIPARIIGMDRIELVVHDKQLELSNKDGVLANANSFYYRINLFSGCKMNDFAHEWGHCFDYNLYRCVTVEGLKEVPSILCHPVLTLALDNANDFDLRDSIVTLQKDIYGGDGTKKSFYLETSELLDSYYFGTEKVYYANPFELLARIVECVFVLAYGKKYQNITKFAEIRELYPFYFPLIEDDKGVVEICSLPIYQGDCDIKKHMIELIRKAALYEGKYFPVPEYIL